MKDTNTPLTIKKITTPKTASATVGSLKYLTKS